MAYDNTPAVSGGSGMVMMFAALLGIFVFGVIIGYIVIQGRQGNKTITLVRNPQTGAIESIVQ